MTQFCCTAYCIEFVYIYFIKLAEVCLPLQNNAAYTVARQCHELILSHFISSQSILEYNKRSENKFGVERWRLSNNHLNQTLLSLIVDGNVTD